MFDQGDIGRRAADVDDNGSVLCGECAAAESGCGRAGEQCFHRMLCGVFQAHQAAVRADNVDFRRNAARAEGTLDGFEKVLRQREQACVEHSACRAFQAGQSAEQSACTYGRQTGFFLDNLCGLLFQYAAVADAIYFTDCAAFDIGKPFLCVRTQKIPVGLLFNLAGDGGAAGQIADIIRVGKAVIRTIAFDAGAVNAEQEQARAAEFALDTGICGERGGQTGNSGLPAQDRVQPVERFQNAARQVIIGGQCLVAAQDSSSIKVI